MEYHKEIRYLVEADRLGSIYPKWDECCPFFTTPDTEEPVVLYEKDREFRKITYDQEEMNDENRY